MFFKVLFFFFSRCCLHFKHCTKIHISQVLEYHGKLKKTKGIPSFHRRFGSKKERIFHSQKVQNKDFSVSSKYNLSINFSGQKRPYPHFTSSNNSKQELTGF